jgi:hypothetical protein
MQKMIPCRKCHGEGVIPMPQHLFETLTEVRGETTTEDLAEKNSSITRNGFNNRLEALRKLGLLTRTRCGKEWIYRKVLATKPKKIP